MAEDMRFHAKYSYKVKEAPEPSEYILENWYYPRYLNWILFFVCAGLIFAFCIVILLFTVKKVEGKFTNIPIYDECGIYNFSLVSTATYTSANSVNQREVSCYCRHLGLKDVKSSSGDTRTLCQNWLDYYKEYYGTFTMLMFAMLVINVVTTYGFKLLFHKRIFKPRYKTTRYILTSICVLVFQFFFLGFLPEYLMDTSIFDLGRTWYLRAGVVYAMYFI